MYESDLGIRLFMNESELLLPWASVKIIQYDKPQNLDSPA
jgi:hypothetical protein